jgi:hypothetical protein
VATSATDTVSRHHNHKTPYLTITPLHISPSHFITHVDTRITLRAGMQRLCTCIRKSHPYWIPSLFRCGTWDAFVRVPADAHLLSAVWLLWCSVSSAFLEAHRRISNQRASQTEPRSAEGVEHTTIFVSTIDGTEPSALSDPDALKRFECGAGYREHVEWLFDRLPSQRHHVEVVVRGKVVMVSTQGNGSASDLHNSVRLYLTNADEEISFDELTGVRLLPVVIRS